MTTVQRWVLEGNVVFVCVGMCVTVAGSDDDGDKHTGPETGRILLQVSFLYPSWSHCFTPSPSQMNKTDLGLSA